MLASEDSGLRLTGLLPLHSVPFPHLLTTLPQLSPTAWTRTSRAADPFRVFLHGRLRHARSGIRARRSRALGLRARAPAAAEEGVPPVASHQPALLPWDQWDPCDLSVPLVTSAALAPETEPDSLTLAAECLERGDRARAAVHLEDYVCQHPDQWMFRVQLAEMLLRWAAMPWPVPTSSASSPMPRARPARPSTDHQRPYPPHGDRRARQ